MLTRMVAPSDAVFPPGALILVTGVNGLVGSYVVDQVLNYGYHVRGTVRDKTKSDWMREYFDQKYGRGKFELVELKELDRMGSLGEAMKGTYLSQNEDAVNSLCYRLRRSHSYGQRRHVLARS